MSPLTGHGACGAAESKCAPGSGCSQVSASRTYDSTVMISEADAALRLLIAAGLGGLVGLERELRDQPAGFRTHILVATGACLFALISAFGFEGFIGDPNAPASTVDVTRVASQIVVGIGFIGGGTILRHGTSVHGLTTAASLWVTAAVGTAVALGFMVGALTASAISVASLALLRPFSKRVKRGRNPSQPPD